MSQKLITFLDNIQRLIIGELVSEDSNSILVKNPAIFNVTPTQQGKLQIQIYPVFFREFLNDKDAPVTWSYNKSAIALSKDTDLVPSIVQQYDSLFRSVKEAAASTPASPSPSIKLFDSEEPAS